MKRYLSGKEKSCHYEESSLKMVSKLYLCAAMDVRVRVRRKNVFILIWFEIIRAGYTWELTGDVSYSSVQLQLRSASAGIS